MTPLWLLLLPVAFCGHISPAENQWLKDNCTQLPLGGPSGLSPIAATTPQSDFSFLAALVMLIMQNGYVVARGEPFCTGVQISSRHILTAAHCFFDTSRFQEFCAWSRSPSKLPEPFQWIENSAVVLNSRCSDLNCWTSAPYFTPTMISLHPGYNPCSDRKLHDLALIEVHGPIPAGSGKPICLPEPWEQLSGTMPMFSGGYGGSSYHTSSSLQYVQYVDAKEEGVLIRAPLKSQQIRHGDSGGPFFEVRQNMKSVLRGIASTYQNETVKGHYVDLSSGAKIPFSTSEGHAVFNDVRKHLDWICEMTGVCPIQQANNNFKNQNVPVNQDTPQGQIPQFPYPYGPLIDPPAEWFIAPNHNNNV
ncbi:trypsin [Ancylostoma duodenale]|uniref:Trypsin n=1 Tax=Ancylostoma duodenale TaxID=51022 RepID=A0A0C2H5R5_9BILA|nr:trypsin [Ancylostoma duodenale]